MGVDLLRAHDRAQLAADLRADPGEVHIQGGAGIGLAQDDGLVDIVRGAGINAVETDLCWLLCRQPVSDEDTSEVLGADKGDIFPFQLIDLG